MCVCVCVQKAFSTSETFTASETEDNTDVETDDLPALKRKKLCQMHIGANNWQQRTIGLLLFIFFVKVGRFLPKVV